MALSEAVNGAAVGRRAVVADSIASAFTVRVARADRRDAQAGWGRAAR